MTEARLSRDEISRRLHLVTRGKAAVSETLLHGFRGDSHLHILSFLSAGNKDKVLFNWLMANTENIHRLLWVAIKGGYPEDFLEDLRRKTLPVYLHGCFEETVKQGCYSKEFLDSLVPPRGFIISTEGRKDEVTTECLLDAINARCYSEHALTELANRYETVPDRCLLSAIEMEFYSETFINLLIDKTVGFEGALRCALGVERHGDSFLYRLVEKTTDFDGCLYTAISRETCDTEILNLLFEKTTDFSRCLMMALGSPICDEAFIEKLFSKTTNFSGCLRKAHRHAERSDELIRRLEEVHTDW